MGRRTPITIVETEVFIDAAASFLEEVEVDELKLFLAHDPEAGDVMPGCGGVRKVRWAAKGRGKRGGARIIYYFYDDTVPVFLLDAYAKSEKQTLTQDDKKCLRALAKQIKELARED